MNAEIYAHANTTTRAKKITSAIKPFSLRGKRHLVIDAAAFRLLTLGQPTMLLDPFFGFCLRAKLAEIAPLVRPRDFDAPIVRLPDRR